MVGQALSWFQWMHKNQQLSSWRAFTIALEQRFGPSTYVNHRATLFKLTQRTTVAAYQSEFETLSNRVTNLPPEALLDCFISGLKSSIQSELAILKPTTLSDAIALAKLVEDKYRPGHRCRTKPFLLLLADDPTDAIEERGDAETVVETCEHTQNEITTEPEPEISLHALEGLRDRPRLANFLYLPIDRTTQFPVAVGNGEKIHSEGTCPHVKFEMQGAEFEADFHVLEFAGADVILGIQWLEGLGKVVTDHKDLTMEFEHKGKPVKLIGRHTPTVLPITCHQLMRLQQIDAMAQCFLLAPHRTNLNQLPLHQKPRPIHKSNTY
nr:Ty3/gypsy retrotransposon protein [Ipomoea batatas]